MKYWISIKELTVKSNQEKQEQDLDFLTSRLFKECESKNGYLGVEWDNIHFGELESEEDTLSQMLFDRILREMEVLSVYAHEYVRDEYNEDAPFRTEHNAKQHVKRLGKFIVKYAPKFLDDKTAESYIEEAKAYL